MVDLYSTSSLFFFFNDTATTEIYTLSLHDALPIFALEGAPQIEEVIVSPRRLNQDVGGGVLEQRSRLSISREPIEDASLHDVHAIDETALGGEVAAEADEFTVVAVGAPSEIVECGVPQRAGARAHAVVGPRSGDLHRREPALQPDDAGIHAQHTIRRVAVDAVGVGESHGRAGAEIAPQPEQVDDRMVARGGQVVVVDRTDVGDAGSADLPGQLRSADGRT